MTEPPAPIPASLITLGVAFYDIQRGHGATDRYARHQTVMYMRRKAAEAGDAMPFYEALANALALRARARMILHASGGAPVVHP